MKPGIYKRLDFDDYLAIKAVSATALKAFVNDSPFHGKAVYDGITEEKAPASVALGAALHCAALTPELTADTIAVGPDARRNEKVWKAFEAENPGKLHLKPSEWRNVEGMLAGLRSTSAIVKILAACEDRELTLVWEDADTGILCKSRLDLYSQSEAMMLDIKTTGDGDEFKFARVCDQLGYDIQFAHYARGLVANGLPFHQAGVLVVEQTAPWWAGICELSKDWFARGADRVTRAMEKWASLTRRGKPWPGYWTGVLTLELPSKAGAF